MAMSGIPQSFVPTDPDTSGTYDSDPRAFGIVIAEEPRYIREYHHFWLYTEIETDGRPSLIAKVGNTKDTTHYSSQKKLYLDDVKKLRKWLDRWLEFVGG